MNEQEFDKALTISTDDSNEFHTEVTASFHISRSVKVDKEVLKSHSKEEVFNRLKAMLRNDLLRDLYTDRRKEMHDAIKAIAVADPYSNQFQHARSELIRVALRQPDASIDSLMSSNKTEAHQSEAWCRLVTELICSYGLNHTEPGEVMLDQVLNFLRRKLK